MPDRRALEGSRQKRRRPVLGTAVGERWLDCDVARQILVLGTEAVDHPGTQAGPRERARACEGLQQGGAVVHALPYHRMHEAHFVHALAYVWKEIANQNAALAARLEIPERFHQRPGILVVEGQGPFDRQRLAVILGQVRLVLERVDRGRAAVHEQEYHPLGPGLEMRFAHQERVGRIEFDIRGSGPVLLEQACQPQQAKAARGVPQHPATRQRLDRVHVFDRLPVVHGPFLRLGPSPLILLFRINPRR